ncbi:MAG: competence protein ComEA [Syntrophaceae bacterium]|nr:MAG: competence protein ComEA [Syntrophaceae bacterium]
MMFERQIKGIIAVSIFLAFIPFIGFFISPQMNSKSPVLSTSGSHALMIEVVLDNGESGVYFVNPRTSVNQMFSQLGFNRKITEDMQLQNGMKIRLVPEEDHRGIVVEKMDAAKRLALGLLLDINLAGRDELKLIPGVGDVLAASIVAEREKIGRFDKLDQLMDIKGIKEKKLSQLKQYLYIDQL